ncbi:uncharacterized protein LOC114526926 [Dendronephthya gigantea]|uniref:uncharacterized protein LOC114526926 n=1 Tax=Dendronephthya gigantea TaxID=151771 RepID=UPI00106C9A63|nr:uncharacterized protein LOC114526926 [Dendronephthya gigantea]
MGTAMLTNRYVDDIIHIIFSVEKISKDKKYKEQKKMEIVNTICALFNSNGGRVELRGEETEGNLFSHTISDFLIRTLEQSLQSRFGVQETKSKMLIKLGDKNEKIIEIRVSKAPSLVTIQYNLYLSTNAQVALIGNVPNTLKTMNRFFVDEPVQLDSHQKTFRKDQDCDLGENEVIQFKLLKSDSSKRVTLADRMISKSNKFSCYVSAFANHRGGHIYYGIDDDGVVQGEKTENISEIKKKVEKAIQKMIWPDVIGQPKRGEQWEIFFEPVLDEKSNPIPSTFVIAIFIAPCFGGVFTEEPESYEMLQGKVERMSFETWKAKLQPGGLNKRKPVIPLTIKRISLSPAAEKRCIEVNEALTEDINNVRWKSFAQSAKRFEHQKYPGKLEVKLMVFLRKLMATYRQGKEASNLFSEYRGYFSRAGEPFESLFRFLENVVARVSDKAATESRDISTDALAIAEMMEHGLLTAAALLIAAFVYDSQYDKGPSPVELCLMALEHLEYVKDATVARPDMIHTAHILLAAYHLGYNMSGKMIKEDVDKESLQKAKISIMTVNESDCDGNRLMPYREIWLTLAQAKLYKRRAQLQPEKQTKFLSDAFQLAKKAEKLARNSGLVEMVCWAQTAIASCTEALLRTTLLKT